VVKGREGVEGVEWSEGGWGGTKGKRKGGRAYSVISIILQKSPGGASGSVRASSMARRGEVMTGRETGPISGELIERPTARTKSHEKPRVPKRPEACP